MKVLIFFTLTTLLFWTNSYGARSLTASGHPLGCSPEEWDTGQCSDKRVPLEIANLNHQPYRGTGVLFCIDRQNKRSYDGSFVFVTTPKIQNSTSSQKFVGLTVAHNFFGSSRGSRSFKPRHCKAKLYLGQKQWLGLRVEEIFLNPQYDITSPPHKSFSKDWAAFSFTLPGKNQFMKDLAAATYFKLNQDDPSSNIAPAVLTPIDPIHLENKNLTLAALDTTHERISLSSNCESRSGLFAEKSNLTKEQQSYYAFLQCRTRFLWWWTFLELSVDSPSYGSFSG